MASFTPIPSNPLSTVPSYQSFPFVSGFRQTVTGNSTFTMGPGCARALCNGNIIEFPNFTAGHAGITTVDVSTVGVNGCFPVSIASLGLTQNTLFPVYAISNSSGTGPTAVNSLTGGTTNVTGPSYVVATGNNFLPPFYDTFVRVGYIFIAEATSFVIPWAQSGHGNEKTYILQDPITGVSAGAATAAAIIDLTSTVGVIPPNKNIEVILNVEITPNAAGGWVAVEPGSLTAGSVSPTQIFGSATAEPSSSQIRMIATPNATTGDANIQYWVNNAGSSATINVVGFVDSLGNALV